MRILRAMARALAAAAAVVVETVWQAGRWVVRCLPGYQPPAPQDVVEEYVDAAETAPVEPQPDQRIMHLQLVADALFRQQPIADAWLVGLSGRTLEWLEAMNAAMLLETARAKPQDLQAHIAGTKAIRGLLAFDQESVAAYIEAANRPLNDRYEPDIEHRTRRPRRRQEPLLPAFGPIA
jgi:hypothetical protein